MELHMQQQQHFQPDVLPTPPSSDELVTGPNDTQSLSSEPVAQPSNVLPSPGLQKTAVSESKSVASAGQRSAGGDHPVIIQYSFVLNQYPIPIICPYCGENIITNVIYQISYKQYLICCVLAFLFIHPCSLIPCLFRSLYNVFHYCPRCGKLIGVYEA